MLLRLLLSAAVIAALSTRALAQECDPDPNGQNPTPTESGQTGTPPDAQPPLPDGGASPAPAHEGIWIEGLGTLPEFSLPIPSLVGGGGAGGGAAWPPGGPIVPGEPIPGGPAYPGAPLGVTSGAFFLEEPPGANPPGGPAPVQVDDIGSARGTAPGPKGDEKEKKDGDQGGEKKEEKKDDAGGGGDRKEEAGPSPEILMLHAMELSELAGKLDQMAIDLLFEERYAPGWPIGPSEADREKMRKKADDYRRQAQEARRRARELMRQALEAASKGKGK